MHRKILGLIGTTIMLLSIGGCGSSSSSKSDTSTPTPTATLSPIPTSTPAPISTPAPTPTPKLSFVSKNKITVNENQIKVTTIKATGSDKFYYFIDDGDANNFEVDTMSGNLYFKKAPYNIEKKSYTFNVIATNDEDKKIEHSMIVTICDNDKEECSKGLPSTPVFTSSENFSMPENSIHPIWITAKSNNKRNFQIEGADARYFSLDKDTGRLLIKNIPDYEEKSSYKLMVTVKDKNRNSEIQFLTINIIDSDENIDDNSKPKFITLDTVHVKEAQSDVIGLYAIDANKVTYSISGDDADLLLVDSKTGKVTFRNRTDYDDKPTYKFTAIAQDGQGNGSTKKITINLLDVGDTVPPKFITPNSFQVAENQRYVATISATDESGVTYSLGGRNASYLEINPNTGYLNFTHTPDYETKSYYNIEITAEDGLGLQTTQSITITIMDVSEITQVKRVSDMAGFWKYSDTSYEEISSNGNNTDYWNNGSCYESYFWEIHQRSSGEGVFYYKERDSNYSTADFTAKIDNNILTLYYSDGSSSLLQRATSSRSSIISNLCN